MKLDINFWNIHCWLLQRDIPHMYIFEDELEPFSGIRFYAPENDTEHFAILYDETHSRQYRSVLTFQNSRIYFQNLCAHEAMNILTEILTEYARCICKVKSINLNMGQLSDVLKSISDYLGYPFILIKDTHIFAFTPGYETIVQQFESDFFHRNIFDTLNEWGQTSQVTSFTYPKLVQSEAYSPFFLGRFSFQQNYIWIFAIGNKDNIHYGNLNLFESFLQYIQQAILLSESQTFNYSSVTTDKCLLDFITSAEPTQASIQSALNRLHWKKDDSYTIYRMELFNYSDSFILNHILAHLHKTFPKAYAMIYDNGIYLFWNQNQCGPFITKEIFETILPTNFLFIGQSNIQNDFSILPVLLRQAKEAVAHGRRQDNHFQFSQEISKEMLYDRLRKDETIQALVHPAIKHLQALDEKSQGKTQYIHTLKTYLLSGINFSLSAKKLNLHRNTLISRIHKIESLTGIDLTTNASLESLLLSIIIS